MSDNDPKREFHFETIETRPDLNYIPAKTRDKRRMELFSGKPRGFVIAWQQRIGTEASSAAFERLVEAEDEAGMRSISNVLAVTALGTAYHTFGQPEQDFLMYRRIPIPEMMDRETKVPTTEQDLIELASKGLADSADQAAIIEEMTHDRRDTSDRGQLLGRMLATTGFTLAVLHDGISKQHGDEVDMQWASWKSARRSSARALELSVAVGARPTIAQLADDHSPFRRYMNDQSGFVDASVYGTLTEEIGSATAAAFARSTNSQTLF